MSGISFLTDLLVNSVDYLTRTCTRLVRNLTHHLRNRPPRVLRHLNIRYKYELIDLQFEKFNYFINLVLFYAILYSLRSVIHF